MEGCSRAYVKDFFMLAEQSCNTLFGLLVEIRAFQTALTISVRNTFEQIIRILMHSNVMIEAS